MAFAVMQSQELETTTCANCGVLFAMPQHLTASRMTDKEIFYCPNGHTLSFKKSEVDRLKEELAREKEAAQRARDESARKDRLLSAARGQATKIKKRISNGVCPCCNRTFINLQRHMGTKHPDWKDQDIEKGVAAP